MSQILDSLPANVSDSIFCCYINQTSKVQIARITNIANWYFERVVFPGVSLLFETSPEAQLEIHMGTMASAIHSDTIPCNRLKVSSAENRLHPHESVDFAHKTSPMRTVELISLSAS